MSYGIERGVHFQILSDEDLDKIHWGTLHILEKIGVQVDSPTCRKLLKDNGCDVDEKTRIARSRPTWSRRRLTKKKAAITLAGRNPKFDAKLDMNHSYMTANGNGAVAVDFETGEEKAVHEEGPRQLLEDHRLLSRTCTSTGRWSARLTCPLVRYTCTTSTRP